MNEEVIRTIGNQEITIKVTTTKEGGYDQYSIEDVINDTEYMIDGLQEGWLEISVEPNDRRGRLINEE
jgi:hypothetical protein